MREERKLPWRSDTAGQYSDVHGDKLAGLGMSRSDARLYMSAWPSCGT